MNTTNAEKLQLINAICKESINIKTDFKEATNSLHPLTETGVDSLDFITVFIYIGDIWGISDDAFNTHINISPAVPRPLLIEDLIVCIIDTHTSDPTLEEALNEI